MAITKKRTHEVARIQARAIKSAGLVDQVVPYVAFVDASRDTERNMPCTKEAFERIKYGKRSKNANLKKGMVKASARFIFLMLVEKHGKEDRVAGVHCIPNRNYAAADFAVELKNPAITKKSIVVDVHPDTGELDIVAAPAEYWNVLAPFIKKLEEMETIDHYVSMSIGNLTISVDSIAGETVIFNIETA